jgi:hypothetical protein
VTEPVEPTPAPPETADADDDTIDDAVLDPRTKEALRKLRNENRSLRTRLRSTETDYEAAATQLAAAQHAEVKRIAAEVLVDPSDLWRAGVDMTTFVDDEFKSIVADRVVETAKALAAEKPHLAKPPTAPPPSNRPIESLRSGARPEEKPPAPTWATAIRGHGG